jgi:hypothetical protein
MPWPKPTPEPSPSYVLGATGTPSIPPIGPCVHQLAPLGEFNATTFVRHAYVGRCPVVSYDLGRTLGLLADWWVPARRKEFRGGWSLGLRGWGVIVTAGTDAHWSSSYGRPKVYIQAAGVHGTRASFGWPRSNPEGKRRGVWVHGGDSWSSYRGRFVDLMGASFAFDGVDSSDLDEHLVSWGMAPIGASDTYAVTPDTMGAHYITHLCGSLHQLGLLVDAEAATWA